MSSEHTPPTPQSARTEGEILEAIARAVWDKYRGGEFPPEAVPTARQLADFLPEFDQPPPSLEGTEISWTWSRVEPVLSAEERAELGRHLEAGDGNEAEQIRRYLERIDAYEAVALVATCWNHQGSFGPLSIAQVHARWRALDPRPIHPLAGLTRGWQERPPEVERSNHPFPLFPRMRVIVTEPIERERGRLFGLVPKGREITQLPLFKEADYQPLGILERVPLLALADATGAPVTTRGPGAPHELAVLVESMLSVRPEDRRREIVRLAVSVRELRDGIWPNGWQRGRDWPQLREVLHNLNSRYVPWGRGGRWYPLILRGLPEGDDLDDLILLDLALPPGSNEGTPIDRRRLAELRPTTGGAYRGLIGVTALSYTKGRTRVRAPDGRWVWSGDPSRYPVLSRQDRRDIAFGVGDRERRNRLRAEIDRPFEGLERAGDILIVDREAFDPKRHVHGWRVVPRVAVEAVRKWLAKRGGR